MVEYKLGVASDEWQRLLTFSATAAVVVMLFQWEKHMIETLYITGEAASLKRLLFHSSLCAYNTGSHNRIDVVLVYKLGDGVDHLIIGMLPLADFHEHVRGRTATPATI